MYKSPEICVNGVNKMAEPLRGEIRKLKLMPAGKVWASSTAVFVLFVPFSSQGRKGGFIIPY